MVLIPFTVASVWLAAVDLDVQRIPYKVTLPTTLAVLLGIGTTNFPLGLYLVTQKARSGAGVLALSGFMQGIGYIMAAAFLILFGTLQGDSTHWGPMLAALIAITLVQLVAALRSVAPWTIEDDLDAHQH